jgi:hypothetical protein
VGSISLLNDRLGFGATTGGLPLPDGSIRQSEMQPVGDFCTIVLWAIVPTLKIDLVLGK